jgi:hypothetical protein
MDKVQKPSNSECYTPSSEPFRLGLSNAVPMIYFPGTLFYSAGFNVNQNFKEKMFLNNSMFQFVS